jgi:hypothetical protein
MISPTVLSYIGYWPDWDVLLYVTTSLGVTIWKAVAALVRHELDQ